MLSGILVLALIAGCLAAALGWAVARLPSATERDVERVNRLLPQTQCGQCGFPGCRPYAAALVAGETELNRCPPGGESLVRELARVLDRPPQPVNPACGLARPPAVAVIDEPACVGCARCLEACPVDAIVGAPRFLHTIISDECTGCELCLPVCPVDCIVMIPRPARSTAGQTPQPRGTR